MMAGALRSNRLVKKFRELSFSMKYLAQEREPMKAVLMTI